MKQLVTFYEWYNEEICKSENYRKEEDKLKFNVHTPVLFDMYKQQYKAFCRENNYESETIFI